MKSEVLLLLALARTILAGPARRDCGETRSFTTTNSCGITYGGGWVECEIGFTALPTFTIPTCAPTSLSSAEYAPAERIAIATSSTDYPVATTTSAPEAIITPPPWLNATATAAPGNASSSSCSPLWICIDALAVCGGVSQMYGNCHDTCTPVPLVPPICTLPPVTSVPSYDRAHPKMNLKDGPKPERVHLAVCDGEESWRCAPKGW